MSELKLLRRITGGAGGWAGDGTVWNGDNPVNAPKPATIQATETTNPIHTISHKRARGFVRVIGGDASRRFDMRLVVGWSKRFGDAQIDDWQLPAGPTPPAPADPRDIGDGEDFDTDGIDLTGQKFALHLVPQGGNLAEFSIIEIWASEVT